MLIYVHFKQSMCHFDISIKLCVCVPCIRVSKPSKEIASSNFFRILVSGWGLHPKKIKRGGMWWKSILIMQAVSIECNRFSHMTKTVANSVVV